VTAAGEALDDDRDVAARACADLAVVVGVDGASVDRAQGRRYLIRDGGEPEQPRRRRDRRAQTPGVVEEDDAGGRSRAGRSRGGFGVAGERGRSEHLDAG